MLFWFSLFGSSAKSIQWVDQIVVIVNQDVVTQRDVDDASRQIKLQTSKADLKTIDIKQIAIDSLVQQRLLKQAAENMQITVSEQTIDDQVAKLASVNKMSTDQFYKAIAKEGVPKSTLRATIKDGLLVDTLAQQVLRDQIEVTNDEIKSLLVHNKMPLTESNRQDARNFITNAKQQEFLSSIVQDLKNRAYIEYRSKPY